MLDSLLKFARNNALGLIAIYIALAGSAFAVHTAAKHPTAPKNSVVTKSIKRGAVTTPKLKKNAVTGKKVRNGSLSGVELADGSITGLQIDDSSLTGVDAAKLGGLAPDAFQKRVTGACSSEQSINAINTNGTVDCVGLGGFQQRVSGSCGAGSTVAGVNADGTVRCDHPLSAVIDGENQRIFNEHVTPGQWGPAPSDPYHFTVVKNATGDYTMTWPDGTWPKLVVPTIEPLLSGGPVDAAVVFLAEGANGVGPGGLKIQVQFRDADDSGTFVDPILFGMVLTPIN